MTAVILFYTTTSLVQGFALTFGFGVLISMFTALIVSKTLLTAIAPKSNTNKTKRIYFGLKNK